MDVIVVGGGMAGVATAWQLRAAGHRVCVIERQATVAQGATYGQSSVALPSPLDVWFGPTLRLNARPAQSGVLCQAGFRGPARQFVKQLDTLRAPDAFARQYTLLHPLAELARAELYALERRAGLDFEQRDGLLYLLRGPRDQALLQPALDLLQRIDIPHQILDAAGCMAHERALYADSPTDLPTDPPADPPANPPLAGGIWLPDARTGNCALFVKQLKRALERTGGVQFLTGREVSALRLESQRAAVELAPPEPERDPARNPERANTRREVMSADALVVAAGADTLSLLAPLGLHLPLYPVRVHALSAPFAHEECVPHVPLVDPLRRIAIARANQRLRITGGGLIQHASQLDKPLSAKLTEKMLALPGEAARNWAPGAAKMSAALSWTGLKLLSSDGLPVVGGVAHPRLFINAGHGPAGWAQALGSGRLIANLVSCDTFSLPLETIAALRPGRLRR